MSGAPTFSYTRRDTYKLCLRAYHLKYNVGLRPKFKSDGLVDGSAFSDALEAWEADAVDGVYEPLLAGANDSEHVDRLIIRWEMVRALARGYMLRYPKPAAREIEFRQPIADTGVVDYGFMDGLEERDGVWWLVEDKLKKSWWGSMRDALPLDNQVTSYLYAASKLAGMPLQASVKHSPGLAAFPRVKGCLYRVTVKPMLKPNKRSGETRAAFLERLRGVIEADAGAHESKYYHEIPLTRSADDFYRHEREVAALVREEAGRQKLGAEDPDGAWRRQERSCHAYGGCEFIPVCLGAPGALEKFDVKERTA